MATFVGRRASNGLKRLRGGKGRAIGVHSDSRRERSVRRMNFEPAELISKMGFLGVYRSRGLPEPPT